MTEPTSTSQDTPSADDPSVLIAPGRSMRRLLIGQTVGTFLGKSLAFGLAFAVSILLARVLGTVEAYGAYVYSLNWVAVLTIPALMGQGRLLVREVAARNAAGDWPGLAGAVRWAYRRTFAAGLVVAAAAVGVAWLLSRGRPSDGLLPTFTVAMVLVPLHASCMARQATLRGLHRASAGEWPDGVVRPILRIALMMAGGLALGFPLAPDAAMVLHIAATLGGLGAYAWLLRRHMPAPARSAAPRVDGRHMLMAGLPLLLVTGMDMIKLRTDGIMLGAIKGKEFAGLYGPATQIATTVTFVLMTMNAVLGSTIAALHATGQLDRLQRVITRATRITAFASVAIASSLILLRNPLLRVWGEEFTRSGWALIILCAGQLVSSVAGPVGLMLSMTGHGRDAAWGVSVGAGLNVVLNAALIPPFGLEGAAIATGTSIVVMNVTLGLIVWRRMRIHTSIFGTFGLGRARHV